MSNVSNLKVERLRKQRYKLHNAQHSLNWIASYTIKVEGDFQFQDFVYPCETYEEAIGFIIEAIKVNEHEIAWWHISQTKSPVKQWENIDHSCKDYRNDVCKEAPWDNGGKIIRTLEAEWNEYEQDEHETEELSKYLNELEKNPNKKKRSLSVRALNCLKNEFNGDFDLNKPECRKQFADLCASGNYLLRIPNFGPKSFDEVCTYINDHWPEEKLIDKRLYVKRRGTVRPNFYRDAEILELSKEGMKPKDIASMYNMKRQRVYEIIRAENRRAYFEEQENDRR